jgi:hypothetical protein
MRENEKKFRVYFYLPLKTIRNPKKPFRRQKKKEKEKLAVFKWFGLPLFTY